MQLLGHGPAPRGCMQGVDLATGPFHQARALLTALCYSAFFSFICFSHLTEQLQVSPSRSGVRLRDTEVSTSVPVLRQLQLDSK